jgi:enoyl-CoA hydratase/carnithine racemase
MEDAPFKITKHSPFFWRITFDNPPINLMNPEMVEGLQKLMDFVETDDRLKVIVFDSENTEYFISHYDVLRASEVPTVSGKLGVQQWVDVSDRLHNSTVISIATIRGRVRGIGSEMILACDMRFASREKAKFGHIEMGMGLVPGGGALEYLPFLSGRAKALEIVLSSDDYSAQTAELYGWINRSLPDNELDHYVNNLATRISSFEYAAIINAKSIIQKRLDQGPDPLDIQLSTDSFHKLLERPQAKALLKQLIADGFQTPGELELNFGKHLGELVNKLNQ